MRYLVLCWLLLMPELLPGAEGIPQWERVLNEVLQRAEQQAAEGAGRGPVEEAPAVHPAVQQFVHFYQGEGSGLFQRATRRLASIRPEAERIFAAEGVPPELIWLGLVESAFNPYARSPKGALGVWQLIPATARRFGLSTGARDERIETAKAARAAAQYLRFLYGLFGDWNLALAAYNAGEGRVLAAVTKGGKKDFFALADAGYLPKETRAYVPAVLAAVRVGSGAASLLEARLPQSPSGQGQVLEAPFSLSP